MPRPRCDCTARCGDDPRLRQGAAVGCDQHLAEREEQLRQMRITDLLMATGHPGDVLGALEELHTLRRQLGATGGS